MVTSINMMLADPPASEIARLRMNTPPGSKRVLRLVVTMTTRILPMMPVSRRRERTGENTAEDTRDHSDIMSPLLSNWSIMVGDQKPSEKYTKIILLMGDQCLSSFLFCTILSTDARRLYIKIITMHGTNAKLYFLFLLSCNKVLLFK